MIGRRQPAISCRRAAPRCRAGWRNRLAVRLNRNPNGLAREVPTATPCVLSGPAGQQPPRPISRRRFKRRGKAKPRAGRLLPQARIPKRSIFRCWRPLSLSRAFRSSLWRVTPRRPLCHLPWRTRPASRDPLPGYRHCRPLPLRSKPPDGRPRVPSPLIRLEPAPRWHPRRSRRSKALWSPTCSVHPHPTRQSIRSGQSRCPQPNSPRTRQAQFPTLAFAYSPWVSGRRSFAMPNLRSPPSRQRRALPSAGSTIPASSRPSRPQCKVSRCPNPTHSSSRTRPRPPRPLRPNPARISSRWSSA